MDFHSIGSVTLPGITPGRQGLLVLPAHHDVLNLIALTCRCARTCLAAEWLEAQGLMKRYCHLSSSSAEWHFLQQHLP